MFYNVTRNVHKKKSKTSHVRTYSLQNTRDIKQNQELGTPVNKSVHQPKPSVDSPASEAQRPGFSVHNAASSVQRPEYRIQFPESSVQSLASRVQRPVSIGQRPASSVQGLASRVQSPASRVQRPNTCVQSPGIPVCPFLFSNQETILDSIKHLWWSLLRK